MDKTETILKEFRINYLNQEQFDKLSESEVNDNELYLTPSDDIPTKVSQLENDAGYTSNLGTITGITMNGSSVGTNGVVNLGTVITEHQDISGKSNVGHKHTKSDITDFPTSLPASDVKAWAKADDKPTYTASEVGALDSVTGTDHINNISNPHGVTKSQVGLGNVGNFKAVSTVASQGLSATEKSNARANIGAGTSNFSGSYNDLSDKPAIPSGAAANKNVDTSIAAGSTSANLPTSAAVASFVEGKGYKTTDNNTTYTFAEGSTNGAFSVTPSDGTASSVKIHGLGSLAYSNATIPTVTDTYSATSSNAMSGKAVASAISGKANTADLPTSYAPTNAQANVIETIKVNNSALTPTNKAVNITVPTGAAASKAVDSSISAASTSANLPTSAAVASFVEGKGYTKNTGTITEVATSSPLSGSGTSGKVTISHANSGATAGSYGDSAAQTPAYGGTFKVPYVTVNATGHVTGISEHTVKIPASDNTNTHRAFYCTCSTAAATAAKVVTCSDTGLKLETGTIIVVTFTNTNTASNVTLNVNSLGAKNIRLANATYTGNSNWYCGLANNQITYMYDGTGWAFVGKSWDANTTYGVATQSANGLMSAADKKALDEMRSVLTGTLAAGETAITFTSSAITNDVFIEPWQYIEGSEEAPIAPTKYSVGTGSVTLYYDAQDRDIRIAIKVGRFT